MMSIFIPILFQNSRHGDKAVPITAYNLLQKTAIGLEVVMCNQQRSNEEYVTKIGNFWKLAYEAANCAIKTVYVFIKSRYHHLPHDLQFFKRSIVPTNVACMTSVTYSDLRDWVILSDSMKITQFYINMFDLYQQNHHLN